MANKTTFFSTPSVIKTLMLPSGVPASYPQSVVNPTPEPAPVAQSPGSGEPEPKLVTSNVTAIEPPGGDTTKLISPFGTGGKIVDVFATSRVLDGYSIKHAGLDLTPVGTSSTLYACCTGTVAQVVDYYDAASKVFAVGYAIDIKWAHSPEGKDYTFRYIHMAGAPVRNGIKLKNGDSVTVGDAVGTYDDTGHSFGAHLHLIVLDNALPFSQWENFGKWSAPHVDPVPVFAAQGIVFT